MRQLVHAVLAAATLPGVLGLPAPAAAEMADQCHQTLNAYRTEGMSLSKGSARTPVEVHRAVRYRTQKTSIPSSAVDANLPLNAAMLAAKAPLDPTTTYTVRVSGFVQSTKGGKWVRFTTRVWSFTSV